MSGVPWGQVLQVPLCEAVDLGTGSRGLRDVSSGRGVMK